MNRKLCTSIKTRGGDIKSYTPVPGDRMQERGTQWKATVQSDSRAFFTELGVGGDRTAMFNNVLGISVVECTTPYKIQDVIQGQRERPQPRECSGKIRIEFKTALVT